MKLRLLLLIIAAIVYSGAALGQNAPTQLSPANGLTGVLPATHTLSWYYISTTPVTYELQVSLSSSFTTTVFNTTITGGINFYNNVPGLFTGTTYFWRVRGTNAEGTSNWSTTWNFSTSGTPPNPFTIIASADSNGTITPSGSFLVTPGGEKSFTIAPDTDFSIEDVLVDGISAGAVSSYTFTTVNAAHTIHASFYQSTFYITASSGSNGSISSPGTSAIAKGANKTYTITPETGYHIVDVLVDSVSVGAVPSYQFNNVQASHTISATFAINTYDIVVTSTSGGTVSPSGTVTADYGTDTTFFFTPDSGYFVTAFEVNGEKFAPDTAYTFSNVTSDQTLHVYFNDHYTIMSSVVGHGTITPLGHIDLQPGQDTTFTIAPHSDYKITRVLVDSVEVDSTTSYTFFNVNGNHSIVAEFEKLQDTIYASVYGDSGGTITPSGAILVTRGDSLRFTIEPEPGYAIAGVVVDGSALSPVKSYLFPYVSVNHTIEVYFRPTKKVFISPGGSDNTGTGTEANPYQTLNRANQSAFYGDTIAMGNGTYWESLSGVEGRFYEGGTATYVPNIFSSGNSNFSIKNIKVNGTNGLPAVGISGSHGIVLDNISLAGSFATGVSIYNSYDFIIKNSNFSNVGGDAVVIYDSHHFTLSDVTANANATGLKLDSVSSFTVNNFTASGNFVSGIIVDNAKNGTFKNLKANNNIAQAGPGAGLVIETADNLTFINGEFRYNHGYGIYITTLIYLTNSSAGMPGNINNLTFKGNFDISHNPTGIHLLTDPQNNMYAITSAVFDGHFYMDDNYARDVYIKNKILSPVFKGFEINKDSVAISVSFLIEGTNIGKPDGIVINHNVFKQGVATAIALAPYTQGVRVDGRYNDFMGAPSPNAIPFFISDSSDFLNNTDLGTVDYSGFSFGLQPSMTVESVPNGYNGASYLLDINLDVKQTWYYFISGRYIYDVTKLDYQGYVSNGLFNENQWNFNVSESVPGIISFTGYGLKPVKYDGSLFQLNMKILPGAIASPAYVGGNPSEFRGNDSVGAFLQNPGMIFYTVPIGPVQDRGDVNLDGVVNLDDFYSLLYYLSDVITITDDQALENADFDLDSDIDTDDLDALYVFVTTGQLPAPVIASGSFSLGTVAYDDEKTSASVPFELKNTNNMRSLEVILKYDAELVNYKAFTSEDIQFTDKTAYAFESKPGEAKFIFQSPDALKGLVNPGELILNFKKGSIPVGADVQTFYKMNGNNMQEGPSFKFGTNGAVTDVETEVTGVPTAYEVSQNYPNPFNPTTNIRFSIPEASNVMVKIYDMLGQEIRTLVSDYMNPGYYTITWNGKNEYGTNVSSGTYIYRISAGNFVQSKKMIFLK